MAFFRVGVDLGRCREADCWIGVGIQVLTEHPEAKSGSKSVGFLECSRVSIRSVSYELSGVLLYSDASSCE